MGAVGAAAPTLLCQWVQSADNVFCTHNILEQKHPYHYIITEDCLSYDEAFAILGSISQ